MKTAPVLSAANALLDLTLDSLAVEVALQSCGRQCFRGRYFRGVGAASVVAGRLLSAGAKTLDIAGEQLWLRLPLAQMTLGPLVFNAVHPRLGELVFTATRALLGAEQMPAACAALSEGVPE